MAGPLFNPAWLAAALLGASATAAGAGIRLPNGPGVNIVYSRCQACHDLQYVRDAKGLSSAQWQSVVTSMQDYGLEISDQDKSTVLKYLITYLGPNPPPAPEETPAAQLDGQTVWNQNCAACHGAQGAGQPGYFPPLAGNSDLFAEQAFPVLVVLNGISGPLTVKGQKYNGSMPALGHLSDDEIAAVVNFVRTSWGRPSGPASFGPVTPKLVARERERPLTALQVHAVREKMLQ